MLDALPRSWAAWFSAVLMLALLALVWSMPRHYQAKSWRGDLRIWATVLIALQMSIYAVFS